MNLQAYLTESGTTQEAFAKKIGVTQGLVSQWLLGKVRVPPERWRDIFAATEGKVTLWDLRPDVFPFSPIDGSSTLPITKV